MGYVTFIEPSLTVRKMDSIGQMAPLTENIAFRCRLYCVYPSPLDCGLIGGCILSRQYVFLRAGQAFAVKGMGSVHGPREYSASGR